MNFTVVGDGCILIVHEVFMCDSALMKQSDDLIPKGLEVIAF